MANQDFNLMGAIKVRPAEEADATPLKQYCFPEKTKKQVTEELKADLETSESGTHRLVAEASGYPIGQVTIKQSPTDSEIAQVGNLAVAGPFRQLGVADHLMAAAEAAATADGAKILEVELAPSESSVIQRYKAWGFAEKPVVVLQKMLDAEAEAEAEAETEAEAEGQGIVVEEDVDEPNDDDDTDESPPETEDEETDLFRNT